MLKTILKNLGSSLLIIVGFELVIAFVIALIWNTAIIWMFPTINEMSYFVALGISSIAIILHLTVNFWTNKYIAVKSVKSLEALMLVGALQSDMMDMRKKLEEKGIL